MLATHLLTATAPDQDALRTFDRLESNVRSYCRTFPTVFKRALNATLEDVTGRRYIDFFAGASALNYGHNNPLLKSELMSYLSEDGITHGLDMATAAKQTFLETFDDVILRPRKLSYKIQFTGPTGTNAVEAAFKLARRVTGRSTVVAFTNGFHGMTLGSLAATGDRFYRNAAGSPLSGAYFAPFDGYFGPGVDTTCYLERMLLDSGSGLDLPAAVIVETIQGEGGINVAQFTWLRQLAALCRRHAILLIVDDIQMGCGRTGDFFSFEEAGIRPDLVTLSKSVSGFGLPMSILLVSPEVDQWKPGEHSGTFRGNNLAFVTASAALRHYWRSSAFSAEVREKGLHLRARLTEIAALCPDWGIGVRGRGMIQALDFGDGVRAATVRRAAFQRGLIVETSGSSDQVVKCMPPLTIPTEQLDAGLEILADSLNHAAG